MFDALKNKQFIIITAIILAIVAMIFIIAYSLIHSSSSPPTTSTTTPPSVTPNPSSTEFFDPYTQKYKDQMKRIRQEEKPIHDREDAVANFIAKLPQVGENFTAAYNIKTNAVIVTINENNKTAGDTEFDQYLQSLHIDDRSWIHNLTVRYKPQSDVH